MNDVATKGNAVVPRRVSLIICIWTIIILSADIKVSVNPHIHWIVTGLAIILIIPYIRQLKIHIPRLYLISAGLFIFSVLIAAFRSTYPLYDIVEAAKLGVILFGAMAFFNSHKEYTHISFKGFTLSAYINCALIIMGIAFLPILAKEMELGRWGTILNYPGSLWRVGIAIFVYSGYLVYKTRFRNLSHIILLLSSLILIVFDGSRTGMLLLPFGLAYVVTIPMYEKKMKSISIAFAFIIALIVGFALIILWSHYSPLSQVKPGQQLGAPSRISSLIESAGKGIWGAGQTPEELAANDQIRITMLKDVIAAIKLHPLFGTGIGSTKSMTRLGLMVVHITYLQVWADIGLLGFLSYLLLVLGWVYRAPEAFKKIRCMTNESDRALYYNTIFMLFFFTIAGVFNPLSTEWSEWITFIIPYVLFMQVVNISQELDT